MGESTGFWKSNAGAAAVEGMGGLAGALFSLFSPDPYKRAFKWSEKARAAKIADVNSLMKPGAPWFSMAGNMPAVNTALTNQMNRQLGLYSGGASGTEPRYPWMG